MREKPLVWVGDSRQTIRTPMRSRPREAALHCAGQSEGASKEVGNVFRDLGFSEGEADHLRVRSELMAKLQTVLRARGLKQAEAAVLLGVTQPRVSDLMRGRIDLFNAEMLIDMLSKVGIRTKVVLESRRRRAVIV